MGLTIHYSLRTSARSSKTARELMARLRGRAMDLPLEQVDDLIELSGAACNFTQYDQEHPNRWLLVQAGQFVEDPKYPGHSYTVTPQHVIAFSTWPGEGCEAANFGLCRYPAWIEVSFPRLSRNRRVPTGLRGWSWHSFCKTQYASNPKRGGLRHFLRCHLTVVAMLDQARSLGILERVSDEGEFWEKRDVEALARAVGQWNEMIAGWAGKLKDVFGDEVLSAITDFPDFEHLEAEGRRKE